MLAWSNLNAVMTRLAKESLSFKIQSIVSARAEGGPTISGTSS